MVSRDPVLILNSSHSSDDRFSLGRAEGEIPRRLDSRIIRYRTFTNMAEIDVRHAQDFFGDYGCTKPGAFAHRVAFEYLLDNFVEDLADSTDLDEVRHYEGETGSPIDRGCFKFRYCSGDQPGGYNIVVNNRQTGDDFTRIARIIELRKGEDRHVVLFDFTSGGRTRSDYLLRKIEAAYDFFGSGNYTLSFVRVYAYDLFRKDLVPKRRPVEDSVRTNEVEGFLDAHSANLCLVFSHELSFISLLGDNIVQSFSYSDEELSRLGVIS